MDTPDQMIAAVGSTFLAGSFFVTVARAIGHDRKHTLVDLIARNVERDPLDAPPYDVQDAVLRQDMGWCIEQLVRDEAAEPAEDQRQDAAS